MARVLVVDDTDIVRRALELAVRKMGHDAESTSSPHEALRTALDRPPALMLLDYRMPGMDGLALFAALREGLGDRCPLVIFVSATPPDEVDARAPAGLRPAGYVKKPFQLEELARAVRRVLEAADAGRVSA
jgi:two-component system, OmpR family, response regulator